jgi:transcriptional regulator with XRE-family HTH domain
MESGEIVKSARYRAGLSQAQLGIRSGLHRNLIGRWERGESSPSLATLQRLVAACGLELVISLAEADRSLDELAEEQLSLTPRERLSVLLPAGPGRDALEVLRWLAGVETPVILIGDIAAVLQGAPQRVDHEELEIVSRDLVSTVTELDAAGFEPADSEARWRDTDLRHPWRHRDGAMITLATNVPGMAGFADLNRSADVVEIYDSVSVSVAHPRDLLRLADASPRESARARAPGLRALLSQRQTTER